ncbi:MAG: thioredoxin domain-containing protein [Desulfarculaceae bacterium]|nr:thioredoxin domain-containing protein [Desulfarculaceae bacterium]MCF8046309.1 thioredoxin domain-containing protein [Desulfarculaceae bacterium]MCF8065870.1 thioredoxin domain-containing protein [Desulfarculaceae bacterium]MCF8097898.1 thioredoxin domain-containing protein [Desulfarculaceae bacterium]MCF8121623.1 thioredoxin domain-containing protein [Desulfarculaceae bacterium]
MHPKRFGFALLLCLCLLPALAWAQPPTEDQIAAYLKNHPEVIMEVLSKHKVELYNLVMDGREVRQRMIWRANIKRGLANPLVPRIDPQRVLLGEPAAKVLVVEYTDFLCPSCRQAAHNLERLLVKDPHRFKLLVKHLPGSDMSRQLALYYEAIGRQDPAKAWRFYQEIFKDQDFIAEKGLSAVQPLVKKLGIDQARLTRDLADKVLAKRLDEDLAEAKAFKLQGTPAFVASGVVMRGPAPVVAFEDVWALSQGQKLPPLQ